VCVCVFLNPNTRAVVCT